MSQERNTTFKYGELEAEFDIADADKAELFEKAVDRMDKTERNSPKAGRLSEIYTAQVNMIKGFFDDIFGSGAGDKACTRATNVMIAYDAYDHFLAYVDAQKSSITGMKNVFGKYSNREQRRHPQNPGQNYGKNKPHKMR